MSYQDSEKLLESLRACADHFVRQFLNQSVSGLSELSEDNIVIHEISDFIISQMLMELKTYQVDTVGEFPISNEEEGD